MSSYKKRNYVNSGLINMHDVAFKAYTIRAEGRSDIDINSSLDYITKVVNDISFGSFRSHNLGYVILHAGEQATWLLIRFWIEGDIVAGFLAADHGDGLERVDLPIIECVWETVVTQFERDAWVKHMMADTPDKTAYLSDQMESGLF